MDRLFLAGLVCELAPTLSGSRIREVGLVPNGLCLTLDSSRRALRASQLAVGLRADSPSLAWFPRESSLPVTKGPVALRSRLQGGVMASFETSDTDRLVRIHIDKRRASGKAHAISLVVEWIGPSSAAYIVDSETKIVDYLSLARPRQTRGEPYVAPSPPPRAVEGVVGPDGAMDYETLVEVLGVASSWDVRGLRRAGVAPVLARELVFRIAGDASPAEVVFALNEELTGSRPQLWLRSDRTPASDKTPIHRVTTYSLTHARESFERLEVDGFNDAVRRGLAATDRWLRARTTYVLLSRVLNRERDRLARLRDKLERELAEAEDAPLLRRYGELLLAGHEGARVLPVDESDVSRVEVDDYYEGESARTRIPFDPRFSLIANAQRYYKRASKQDRRRSKLEERLMNLAHEFDFLETQRLCLDELGSTATDDEDVEGELIRLRAEFALRPRLARGVVDPKVSRGSKSSRKSAIRAVSPRRFRTTSGKLVLAGKSATSNAELSFRLASPDDPWFHVLGMPGSHVVLKLEPNAPATDADLREAAALAAHFSRARTSSYAEVMVSSARHLSKIRGAPPGTVRVAEYRSLRVAPAVLPPDEPELDREEREGG